MSGHLDDLSPKQEAHLTQFKLILSDVLEKKHDDYLLLQFLRARCFDLKKSGEMFRRHLEWRKRFPDDLGETGYEPTGLVKRYACAPFLGFDKEGSPIRLIPLSDMDIVGITSSIRLKDAKDFAVWCLDNDKRATNKFNAKFDRHVETRTFIIDVENLTFRQFSHKSVLEFIVSFLKLYEANYPENLKVAFIINIPYFFAWVFNIIKSFLTEETIKKLRIFGKDGWKKELQTLIDEELLPGSYGGTKTDADGDQTCPSLFADRGPIPELHYLKNQSKLNKDNEDVQKLTVPRRDKREVEIVILDVGCSIVWEAECLENDLLVGVFYKQSTRDKTHHEEVVSFNKFGADYGPSSGSYLCKKKGKYALMFDNTYSMLRSKQVLYRICVLPVLSSESNINQIS